MSVPLAQALADVELEVGQTYRCRVRGRRVELKVLPESSNEPAATLNYTLSEIHPDDIRLDPWCELPSPEPVSRVLPRTIVSHPFDVPEIPNEEELS